LTACAVLAAIAPTSPRLSGLPKRRSANTKSGSALRRPPDVSSWIKWTGDRPFRGDKLLRVKFANGKISKEVLKALPYLVSTGIGAGIMEIIR